MLKCEFVALFYGMFCFVGKVPDSKEIHHIYLGRLFVVVFFGVERSKHFFLWGGTSKNFPFVACFILTSEKSQTIFKLWKMSKLFSPAAGSHSRRNKKYWVQPQVFPLIKLKLLKTKKKRVGPYYMFIPAFCFTVWLDSLHRNP